MADEEVRIRGTVMGGGFGGKEDITGQIHAALARSRVARSRSSTAARESLRVHPKRHATIIRVRTGHATASSPTVEAERHGDSGAYASLGDKVMTRATTHATGPYAVPNAKIDCYAMYEQARPAAFAVSASPGRPLPSNNMDILARAGHRPHRTAAQERAARGRSPPRAKRCAGSVGLLECLSRDGGVCARRDGASPRQPWQEGAKRYAWGVAAGYKNTGLGGGAPTRPEADRGLPGRLAPGAHQQRAELGQNLVGVLAACARRNWGCPLSG